MEVAGYVLRDRATGRYLRWREGDRPERMLLVLRPHLASLTGSLRGAHAIARRCADAGADVEVQALHVGPT